MCYRQVETCGVLILADNYTFDRVKEFIYLGSTLANRCCYGLNGQLSNREFSRTTKLMLYAHSSCASLWRRAMDPIKHRCNKSYVRSWVQCELAMISAFDITVSCISFSMTWTLSSVFISNGCAGSAMSFRRMLRRDGYLMPESAGVVEEDDLISVGRTKSRKPCY